MRVLFVLLAIVLVQEGFSQDGTKMQSDTTDFEIIFSSIPQFKYKHGKNKEDKILHLLIDYSLIPKDCDSQDYLSLRGRVLLSGYLEVVSIERLTERLQNFEDEMLFSFEFNEDQNRTYFADVRIIVSPEMLKKAKQF
jgi:hypothetical protein